MGFLNKLFGQGDKTEQPNETKPQQNLTPCKTEQELIERFGGNSFDKQLDFGEIIGDNNWNVDMPKGEISFGYKTCFPNSSFGGHFLYCQQRGFGRGRTQNQDFQKT